MSKTENRLELYFSNPLSPELYRTLFIPPYQTQPIVGLRGTTLHSTCLPFIWGPASQAISLLLVSAVVRRLSDAPRSLPLLEGPSLSPAGAIARLLTKRTTSWLHDLFGSDVTGRSLLHRMIVLGNARGRQQGPITATLNENYLSSLNISILIDGEDISQDLQALLQLRDCLRSTFIPRRDPFANSMFSRHRRMETKTAS
jgi:hypothetical protein